MFATVNIVCIFQYVATAASSNCEPVPQTVRQDGHRTKGCSHAASASSLPAGTERTAGTAAAQQLLQQHHATCGICVNGRNCCCPTQTTSATTTIAKTAGRRRRHCSKGSHGSNRGDQKEATTASIPASHQQITAATTAVARTAATRATPSTPAATVGDPLFFQLCASIRTMSLESWAQLSAIFVYAVCLLGYNHNNHNDNNRSTTIISAHNHGSVQFRSAT